VADCCEQGSSITALRACMYTHTHNETEENHHVRLMESTSISLRWEGHVVRIREGIRYVCIT
jgi:hypothetical protein